MDFILNCIYFWFDTFFLKCHIEIRTDLIITMYKYVVLNYIRWLGGKSAYEPSGPSDIHFQ